MLNYVDPYFIILVVPALILGLLAQALVSSTYKKYDKVMNQRGLTGEAAALALLSANGLRQVRIEKVAGRLSDNYDPRTQVLHLSDSTIASRSVAAVGVAAHETGHAIQQAEGYLPNRIRALLVPAANLGSFAGPYLAIFGLILNFGLLVNIGIALFAAAVVFYLVTLPVEFDASRRAIRMLGDSGMLSDEELSGARKVLRAAAMTYVASALAAIASLVRLLLLANSGRKKD